MEVQLIKAVKVHRLRSGTVDKYKAPHWCEFAIRISAAGWKIFYSFNFSTLPSCTPNEIRRERGEDFRK